MVQKEIFRMKSLFCQNDDGQIAPVYSISAGLDYPGIGPEHANLQIQEEAKHISNHRCGSC